MLNALQELLKLSSIDTLKEIEKSTYATEDELYSDQDYVAMKEAIQKLADKIIETLFGKKNKLSAKRLIGLDIEICQWMLSPDLCCKAVLNEASIDIKHENKFESERELERDTRQKETILK